MSDFMDALGRFAEESADLQRRQGQLEVDAKLHLEKLHGFFRQHGLPDNFTLPQLALLGAQKGAN